MRLPSPFCALAAACTSKIHGDGGNRDASTALPNPHHASFPPAMGFAGTTDFGQHGFPWFFMAPVPVVGIRVNGLYVISLAVVRVGPARLRTARCGLGGSSEHFDICASKQCCGVAQYSLRLFMRFTSLMVRRSLLYCRDRREIQWRRQRQFIRFLPKKVGGKVRRMVFSILSLFQWVTSVPQATRG